MGRWVRIAVVVVVGVVVLAGCHGSTPVKDMRAWFRGYASRATSGTLHSVYGLQPLGSPYVGQCQDHRAAVSWQATVKASVLRGFPSPQAAAAEVSTSVLGLLLNASELSSSSVEVINANVEGRAFQRTLVLSPASGSSVQVTVPLGTSVLMAGHVGC